MHADDRTRIADRRADNGHHQSNGAERRTDETRRQDTVAGALNVIVVEAGQLHYGLIVDELFDSEEIVIKPLGRHMKDCPCLAGATILGDGQVALILDITGIATHTNLQVVEGDDAHADDEEAARVSDEKQSILLVTNHPKEYFGIPMTQVARIERVAGYQIDSIGGQELLQYRGGSLPLMSLENHITAKPREDNPSLHVVVPDVVGREVGLIVPTILDIREVTTDVDRHTVFEPGVLGSIVVDKMTIRLIDLYQLATIVHLEWAESRDVMQKTEDRTERILLAEDSDFFRHQVTDFLRAAGYEVSDYADGLLAWNALQEAPEQFDLVITDLEMPNLDGFGLCRRIKEEKGLSHLPVIALTSLAGEADMQRGMHCGVDDYQVKMDREKLLASVAKYLLSGGGQTVTTSEHSMVGAGR